MSHRAKGLLLGGGVLLALYALLVAALVLTGDDPGTAAAGPRPAATEATQSAPPPPEATVTEPPGDLAPDSPASSDGSDAFGTPANETRYTPGRPSQQPGRQARDGSAGEPNGGRWEADPGGAPDAEPAADEPAPKKAVGLTDIETKRAEAAAFNFLRYAYGYSGDKREQYEAYVNQAVVPQSFRESPGAGVVEDFAANVASGSGVRSTLTDQHIELSPSSKTRATARTTFVLKDPAGERFFSQELDVTALGPIWKVASAGPLEPAQDGGERP